jgi:beta-galactosidase
VYDGITGVKMRAFGLLGAACALAAWAADGRAVFTGDFAPQEGAVKAPERPLRQELCLNGAWRFQPVPIPSGYEWDKGVLPELPPPADDKWDRTPIRIPSPWNANHWGNGPKVGTGTDRPCVPDSVYYPSYPEHWIHYHMAWLERAFEVPPAWPASCRLVLHFESVAGECQVFVNGRKVGEHFDKYLPFDIDVTDAVTRGSPNALRVGVRSYRLFDKRHPQYAKMIAPYPNGSNTDRLSGIWQDVSLLAQPAVRAEDAFVQPWLDRDSLDVVVTVRNDTDRDCEAAVGGDVFVWVNEAGAAPLAAPVPKWRLGDQALSLSGAAVRVPARGSAACTLTAKPAGRLKTWSPGAPNLYGLVVRTAADGVPSDAKYQRFGWRQFKIDGRDLLLNGAPIQLRGDLCHPFGAYMWSRRFVWAWYTMIKDMHGNAVRPHAQVYPRCYVELADEMGICVLDETAVFGSSIRSNFAEPEFWTRYADHFKGLIRRDRNSPSVFGWSFGNEMFAVFRLNEVGKEDEKRWYDQLARTGLEGQRHDPTRPWLSCDGDEDLFGALPVWSKHYGHNLPPLAENSKGVDKPLMVGESGGTYYARPADLEPFAGERAFLDYAGRNDALGVDVYQNVVKMANANRLAYFSASETVWFGLEHLPFGCSDFTRPPSREDGVLFEGVSQEGKFGMQVERLPPYVSTLNPGWDASLPLYKPLAMFEAQRAAQDPRGPQPCKWDHPLPTPARPKAPPPSLDAVAYAGGAALRERLAAWGVRADAADSRFLVLDGAALPADARERACAALAAGGTVLIFAGDAKAEAAAISVLLPAPVSFTERVATALERGDDAHPWAAPFGLADLYFAEEEPPAARAIMRRGMAGPFVDGSVVVLTASRTDWSLFNRRAEEEKVGAVACYERLVKPSGAALVSRKVGAGIVVVCTLDAATDSPARRAFWRRLFENMGVKIALAEQTGSGGKKAAHDLLLDGPQK